MWIIINLKKLEYWVIEFLKIPDLKAVQSVNNIIRLIEKYINKEIYYIDGEIIFKDFGVIVCKINYITPDDMQNLINKFTQLQELLPYFVGIAYGKENISNIFQLSAQSVNINKVLCDENISKSEPIITQSIRYEDSNIQANLYDTEIPDDIEEKVMRGQKQPVLPPDFKTGLMSEISYIKQLVDLYTSPNVNAPLNELLEDIDRNLFNSQNNLINTDKNPQENQKITENSDNLNTEQDISSQTDEPSENNQPSDENNTSESLEQSDEIIPNNTNDTNNINNTNSNTPSLQLLYQKLREISKQTNNNNNNNNNTNNNTDNNTNNNTDNNNNNNKSRNYSNLIQYLKIKAK